MTGWRDLLSSTRRSYFRQGRAAAITLRHRGACLPLLGTVIVPCNYYHADMPDLSPAPENNRVSRVNFLILRLVP